MPYVINPFTGMPDYFANNFLNLTATNATIYQAPWVSRSVAFDENSEATLLENYGYANTSDSRYSPDDPIRFAYTGSVNSIFWWQSDPSVPMNIYGSNFIAQGTIGANTNALAASAAGDIRSPSLSENYPVLRLAGKPQGDADRVWYYSQKARNLALTTQSVSCGQFISTTNTVYLVEGKTIGRLQTGVGSAGTMGNYRYTFSVKNVSNSIQILGFQSDYTYEDDAAWSVSVAVNAPIITIVCNHSNSQQVTWQTGLWVNENSGGF